MGVAGARAHLIVKGIYVLGVENRSTVIRSRTEPTEYDRAKKKNDQKKKKKNNKCVRRISALPPRMASAAP